MTAFVREREPTTPGEILREEFLIPLGITQKQLADHLGCDVKVVNRIVNGRSAVSTEMAMKLGAAFRTTPDSGSTRRRRSISGKRRNGRSSCHPPLVRAS